MVYQKTRLKPETPLNLIFIAPKLEKNIGKFTFKYTAPVTWETAPPPPPPNTEASTEFKPVKENLQSSLDPFPVQQQI